MNGLPKDLQFKYESSDEEIPHLEENHVDPVTEEKDPNFIYAEDEPPEIEDLLDKELGQLTQPKTKVNVTDIFDDYIKKEDNIDEDDSDDEPEPLPVQPNPVVKKVRNKRQTKKTFAPSKPRTPTPPPPAPEPEPEPVKLTKAGKPRKKRVYTEEQKAAMRDRLALAREKKKNGTNKASEEKKKRIHKEKLLKEKEDMDIEELENEVVKRKQLKAQPKAKSISLTKAELEESQLEAIMKYEHIRKQRKKKKKDDEAIVQAKDDLRNKVLQSTQGWKEQAGIYHVCY